MGVRWGKFLPGTTVRTVRLVEHGAERAFAVVHKRDGTVYIADMEVSGKSRRRGYGSKLLHSIERKVCDKPRVLTLLSRPEAVGFWRKLGFTRTYPVCSVEGCWEWMAKPCNRRRLRHRI